MSYCDFAERVDIAYWWSFSGEGSAINKATPSSSLYDPQSKPGFSDMFVFNPILDIRISGLWTSSSDRDAHGTPPPLDSETGWTEEL